MERDMKRTVRKPKAADKLVRMYPNNGLKERKLEFSKTFSAVTVLEEMFFAKKAEKTGISFLNNEKERGLVVPQRI